MKNIINVFIYLEYMSLFVFFVLSDIYGNEINQSIFINNFEISNDIDEDYKIKIENSLMNNLLNNINDNKLDYVVFDNKNIEESIKRSIYNARLGKNFNSSDIYLEYTFVVNGTLSKSSDKCILLINLSSGERILKTIKTERIEFYDYQLSYYMNEVSKYILYKDYKINELNKPTKPYLESFRGIKIIPLSESKLNIVDYRLSERESLFIEELQSVLLLADKEFRDENYEKAYEYYKNINEWSLNKEYEKIDKNILDKIYNISKSQMDKSIYNLYLVKYRNLTEKSKSFSDKNNIDGINSVYKENLKIISEYESYNGVTP